MSIPAEDDIEFTKPEPPQELPRLSLRGLDTYRIRQVEWLDRPFLQRSAFHLLAGRKGSCKGTWLCGLAARVSRGDLYPQPKRVLVITSEDSVELDFLPRLVAAGGDPAQVTIVNGPFMMPADIPWLKDQAIQVGNVGLIIIDPIGNHLGGADTDKEGLVRVGISPLNPLADELDCMIVGVRHLGKDSSRGALASVLGSTAWVDVPRCVILMAADDEDELLYHAQVVTGNRGPRRNTGRAYRLELVDVPPATEITLVIDAGESSKDVEHLLGATSSHSAPESKSAKARELILDILDQEGQQESDAFDARIAEETGLAAKSVRNIRSQLKSDGLIAAFPEKDELGAVVRWMARRTLAPRKNAQTEPNPDPDAEEIGTWENPHPVTKSGTTENRLNKPDPDHILTLSVSGPGLLEQDFVTPQPDRPSPPAGARDPDPDPEPDDNIELLTFLLPDDDIPF